MLQIDDFVTQRGITVQAKICPENARVTNNPHDRHYRCLLKRGDKTLSVFHSRAAHQAPTPAQVLNSLAIDALESEAATVTELGADLNISTEEARARIKLGTLRAKALSAFLGADDFKLLLRGVARIT